jgi:solute carrier family 25 (mitochondrial oxoglutarate transporter), member 11
MAMNVGMMACSDQAKEVMLTITKDDPKNPGMTTRLGAAATGGFFAAFLSLPFDLLKSRMQNARSGQTAFKGLTDCAIQVTNA